MGAAAVALRLGRYFGNDPQFWPELQSQYGLAVVEGKLQAQESAEPDQAQAVQLVRLRLTPRAAERRPPQ
jgi:plasmid maintenance system antidote protein VapI